MTRFYSYICVDKSFISWFPWYPTLVICKQLKAEAQNVIVGPIIAMIWSSQLTEPIRLSRKFGPEVVDSENIESYSLMVWLPIDSSRFDFSIFNVYTGTQTIIMHSTKVNHSKYDSHF